MVYQRAESEARVIDQMHERRGRTWLGLGLGVGLGLGLGLGCGLGCGLGLGLGLGLGVRGEVATAARRRRPPKVLLLDHGQDRGQVVSNA